MKAQAFNDKKINKLNEQNVQNKYKMHDKDGIVTIKNPLVFTKKLNTNYKLVPFNVLINDVGKTKYLPPVSKEWKNTSYNYNYNNSINLPINDLRIYSLIKGYFSLYFNNKFIEHKYISRKRRRRSYNKIFVSKAEIKHTNEKAIITLYVFNKERLSLLKKIQTFKSVIFNIVKIKGKESKFIMAWSRFIFNYTSQFNIIMQPTSKILLNYFSILLKPKIKNGLKYINRTFFTYNIRYLKKVRIIFSTIRRLRLKLSLNKNKFEENFLNKLANYISKYYEKKIEFNIVNLKSLAYNSDIFTQLLTLKIKKLNIIQCEEWMLYYLELFYLK
jgi:hypothetical protein